MSNKLVGTGVVVSLVLGVFGLFVGDSVVTNPVIEKTVVGSGSGQEHSFLEYFSAGIVQGGGCFATSTAATGAVAGTLTAAQMEKFSCFEVTNNLTGTMALSLPASTTFRTVLPNAGDSRSWIFYNATGTAAATLTLTAGTGIDLVAATANDDLIDNQEYSRVTCMKKTNTDVVCITNELAAAD